jgi:hypothetical protein
MLAEVLRLLVASSTGWLRGGYGRTLAAAGAMDRLAREQLTAGWRSRSASVRSRWCIC